MNDSSAMTHLVLGVYGGGENGCVRTMEGREGGVLDMQMVVLLIS